MTHILDIKIFCQTCPESCWFWSVKTKKLAFSIKNWHSSFAHREKCHLETSILYNWYLRIYLLDKTEKFPWIPFSWLCVCQAKLPMTKIWSQNLGRLRPVPPAERSTVRSSSKVISSLQKTETNRRDMGRKPTSTTGFPTNPLVFASVPSHLGPVRHRAELRLWRATLSFTLGRHHQ